MNELPLEAPPGGDVILSTRYIIGIAIITALAALIVCLRMYVRAALSRSIGWDDWIMVVASVSPNMMPSCVILKVRPRS